MRFVLSVKCLREVLTCEESWTHPALVQVSFALGLRSKNRDVGLHALCIEEASGVPLPVCNSSTLLTRDSSCILPHQHQIACVLAPSIPIRIRVEIRITIPCDYGPSNLVPFKASF